MIGSLLYLTASRPNIMFSVCLYTRFQSNPKESHLKEVKRILRYLKGTTSLEIFYSKSNNFDLIAYTVIPSIQYQECFQKFWVKIKFILILGQNVIFQNMNERRETMLKPVKDGKIAQISII